MKHLLKYIFFTAFISMALITNAAPSKSVAQRTLDSMQPYVNLHARGTRIINVHVIKDDGERHYKALVTLQFSNFPSYIKHAHVIVDGNNLMWQLDNGETFLQNNH